MEVGLTFLIIAVAVVGIWVVVEVKRLRHKLFAIFLIALILFGYLSVTFVFRDRALDYHSVSGLVEASGVYMSWLGSSFGNFKSITSHAIKLDWKGEENVSNETIRRE